MEDTVTTNVIKRNGEEVHFDRAKIVNAITKANGNVERIHQMNPYQIEAIADTIAEQVQEMPHAVNVEDIQDMVEKQIMNRGRYELAKATLFIATTGPLSVKPIRRMNPSCL